MIAGAVWNGTGPEACCEGHRQDREATAKPWLSAGAILRPWQDSTGSRKSMSDPDGLAPVVSPGEEQGIPRRGSHGAPGAVVRGAIPIDREGVAEFPAGVQFPEHGGRAG